jgi:hypothetical protein
MANVAKKNFFEATGKQLTGRIPDEIPDTSRKQLTLKDLKKMASIAKKEYYEAFGEKLEESIKKNKNRFKNTTERISQSFKNSSTSDFRDPLERLIQTSDEKKSILKNF